MASKGSKKWSWNYFTRCAIENAECNICNKNIEFPVNLHCIKSHLLNKHSVFNPTLNLHYDIENGKMRCIHCNTIYKPEYYYYIINQHLADIHDLNINIANELEIWVQEYRLQFNEKCETCNQFNEINSFKLMIHLYKVHNITVPSKFIPVSLSKSLNKLFFPLTYAKDIPTSSSNQQQICSTDLRYSSRQWIRHYYATYDMEEITCIICDQTYTGTFYKSSIKTHVEKEHSIICKSSEELKCSIIGKKIICGYCTNFKTHFNLTNRMLEHIINYHKLNKDMTNKLERWVTYQLIEECEICKQFKEYNSFISMIHLFSVHRVTIPSQLIPIRLSDRLSKLFYPDKNVENIPTSSSKQQQSISTESGGSDVEILDNEKETSYNDFL